MRFCTTRYLLYFLTLIFSVGSTKADTVTVAVASNFIGAMKQLEKQFEAQSSHELSISYASSGKLYAQIRQGAPFDIFLSADREIPRRLIDDGLAKKSSRFTYARGQLVLWSAKPRFQSKERERLLSGDVTLAMANPRVAPYGVAAIEVLQKLDIEEDGVADKVLGENVGQAFQFVRSQNADLGFVALSQLVAFSAYKSHLSNSGPAVDKGWLVPQEMYSPVYQDAVRLIKGLKKEAVNEFWDFLKSAEAQSIIKRNGYLIPENL